MIGLIIVILSAIGIMYSSYMLGISSTDTNLERKSVQRNTALTVMAVSFAGLLLGVLSSVGGKFNPMAAVINPPPTS
jgi:NADH:ubiquinone oxidoreductase subunit 6 (subunit J)